MRRLLAIPLLGALATAALLFAPAIASADNSSSLTVVGTSDVSDSGLIPNLIGPEFEQAFPQFTFKYIGTASGAAITAAENGSDQASVLITHAPTIENQFVGSGYSYQNQFGHAIFTNDFVLAGPTADPAGVTANGAHDIVQAFADVATAGDNGGGTPQVSFIVRGNTSGTSIAEHQIWALVGALPTQPSGLHLCTLATGVGGGETPVTAASGLGGTSCGAGLPPVADVPPWYVVTGLTQGPNVNFANTCNSANPAVNSGPNTCYVFTDRGTYDYLQSGTDPTGTANQYFTIPNLTILTRNNSITAPGGQYELVNYFHAYIINPNATVLGGNTLEPVNLPAAQDFVNFVTSPAIQAQLKNYLLDNTGDSGGPPFVADASPSITENGIPATDPAGTAVTVTGTVSNVEPGYPTLANEPVTVEEIEGGLPVAVASGTTNSTGAYSIGFTPTSSGSYEVTTGTISQVVNGNLTPVFGDVLSPGATAAVPMNVQGLASIAKATPSIGAVAISGSVAPAAVDANARVTILARPQGSSAAFTEIGGGSLAAGQQVYALNGTLAPGAWQVEAIYQDSGQLLAATSTPVNVTVPAPATTTTTKTVTVAAPLTNVSFKKVSVKNGALTVAGTLSRAPAAKGASVELFALSLVKLPSKTKAKKASLTAHVTALSFKQVGKTSIGTGKKTLTIKAKLKRGFAYVLQLEYVNKGQSSTFSKLKSLNVN